MLVLSLILAVLFLAFANGANDNFKATATLHGSGDLDFAGARRLATIAQIAGSTLSLFWAGALVKAFGGKGLVSDAIVADPGYLAAVGAGAAATVLIATRLGLPISTTHALVGGLVGAGVILSPAPIVWRALGATFVVPLLASPLLALAAAALVHPLAHRLRERSGVETSTCLCVGSAFEAVRPGAGGALVLERTGIVLTVDETAACRDRYAGDFLGFSFQALADRLHRVSAFSLGFARGLNDTPKIFALVVAAGIAGLDPRIALAVIALAMALGGWLRAERVAETLSHRITPMRSGQGLVANAISSAMVIGASLAGAPVSTTHVSTGALFGIGLWNRETDWKVVGEIALAWVVTLPLAALLAGGFALLLAQAGAVGA